MTTNNNLIFISIASYRDPQLVPTITDCLCKAAHPERLRFGICWQHDETETLTFHDDPRFRILDIPWSDSLGACWARAEIMKLYAGEDWFLQLDSHCRFAQDWDTTLIRTAAETASPKPILSTYATPFTPGGDEVLTGDPLWMEFHGFTPTSVLQLKPNHFTKHQLNGRPLRARFLAAGFLFASGSFVDEVPYDPELYFLGEETAMTLRAFTHGYDIFHPAESIVWHYYSRTESKHHWDDHTEAKVGRPWGTLETVSSAKLQRLLRGEPVSSYGLGTARTLEEYETFAGLSFRYRKAQEYTTQGHEPPNPPAPSDWMTRFHSHIAKVPLLRSQLHAEALDHPKLWIVDIRDDQGASIHRRDLTPEELRPLLGSGEKIAVICEFSSSATPTHWSLLPLSSSGEWLERLYGQLREGDVAIITEDESSPVAASNVSLPHPEPAAVFSSEEQPQSS